VDVVALIEAEIVKPVRVYGPEAPRRTDGDLNTDPVPRDEYLASERFWPSFARGSGPE
jgi:hypothetical protein